jgi:hypothetical protein
MMPDPRPANLERVAACEHFAPLETPPHGVGNDSNGGPQQSANDPIGMRTLASLSQKAWIVVENGRPEYRNRFPTSVNK